LYQFQFVYIFFIFVALTFNLSFEEWYVLCHLERNYLSGVETKGLFRFISLDCCLLISQLQPWLHIVIVDQL